VRGSICLLSDVGALCLGAGWVLSQDRRSASRLEDVAEQGLVRSYPAEMRGDLDQLAAMGVELAGGDVHLAAWSNRGFQQRFAGLLIRDLEPRKMRKKGRGRIARIDAETIALVERPPIPAQVRDVVAAAVVEIHGQHHTVMARAYLQYELLFPLYLDDAVRIAKNIRAEPQLETVFEPVGTR